MLTAWFLWCARHDSNMRPSGLGAGPATASSNTWRHHSLNVCPRRAADFSHGAYSASLSLVPSDRPRNCFGEPFFWGRVHKASRRSLQVRSHTVPSCFRPVVLCRWPARSRTPTLPMVTCHLLPARQRRLRFTSPSRLPATIAHAWGLRKIPGQSNGPGAVCAMRRTAIKRHRHPRLIEQDALRS